MSFTRFLDTCSEFGIPRKGTEDVLKALQPPASLFAVDLVVNNVIRAFHSNSYSPVSVAMARVAESLGFLEEVQANMPAIMGTVGISECRVAPQGNEIHPLKGKYFTSHPVYSFLCNSAQKQELRPAYGALQLHVLDLTLDILPSGLSMTRLQGKNYAGGYHSSFCSASRVVRDMSLADHDRILQLLDVHLIREDLFAQISSELHAADFEAKELLSPLNLLYRHATGQTKLNNGGGGSRSGSRRLHTGFVETFSVESHCWDAEDPKSNVIRVYETFCRSDRPDDEMLSPEEGWDSHGLLEFPDENERATQSVVSNYQAARGMVNHTQMQNQVLLNDKRRLTLFEMAIADKGFREICEQGDAPATQRKAAVMGLCMLWLGRTFDQLITLRVNHNANSFANLLFDQALHKFRITPYTVSRKSRLSPEQKQLCHQQAKYLYVSDIAGISRYLTRGKENVSEVPLAVFNSNKKPLKQALGKIITALNELHGTRISPARLSHQLWIGISTQGLRDPVIAQLFVGRALWTAKTAAHYRYIDASVVEQAYEKLAKSWFASICLEQKEVT